MSTRGSAGLAAIVGGVAGAALASRRGVRAVAIASVAGAAGLAASETVARARQRKDEIPALWQRIAVSAALGLRPQKVVMGPARPDPAQ